MRQPGGAQPGGGRSRLKRWEQRKCHSQAGWRGNLPDRNGPGTPITALRGLWVYGGHWALEAAKITETRQANGITDNAVGQIIVDGRLLNESLGYEEAFSFQTLKRPAVLFLQEEWQDRGFLRWGGNPARIRPGAALRVLQRRDLEPAHIPGHGGISWQKG